MECSETESILLAEEIKEEGKRAKDESAVVRPFRPLGPHLLLRNSFHTGHHNYWRKHVEQLTALLKSIEAESVTFGTYVRNVPGV